MDKYDPTGQVVNSAVNGIKKATFDIEGQQVCGTIIYKGGPLAPNHRAQCKVHIARIQALNEVYDFTTNGLPLEVVLDKALVRPHSLDVA
jgi:hypothetical protein